MNKNFNTINVATQENDPDSVLNFYRLMIQKRKDNLTLVYGDYEDIRPEDKKSMRTEGGMINMNFSW